MNEDGIIKGFNVMKAKQLNEIVKEISSLSLGMNKAAELETKHECSEAIKKVIYQAGRLFNNIDLKEIESEAYQIYTNRQGVRRIRTLNRSLVGLQSYAKLHSSYYQAINTPLRKKLYRLQQKELGVTTSEYIVYYISTKVDSLGKKWKQTCSMKVEESDPLKAVEVVKRLSKDFYLVAVEGHGEKKVNEYVVSSNNPYDFIVRATSIEHAYKVVEMSYFPEDFSQMEIKNIKIRKQKR